MKFLIAGYGSIGRRHLRNLQALGERDILLLRSHRSTLPEEEIAGIPVETSLEAALAHAPDAVIVANPSALHMQVAIPAARAGCHLLIEKPLAENLEHAQALKSALAEGGGKALVGFQFRFHPALQKAAALLAEGAIGSITSGRVHWGEYLPNWHPWEDFRQGYAARADLGGGVILTLCHAFDYLPWLMGEVEALWAFSSCLGLGLEVEDTAEIGLRFRNGATGLIHLDYVQRPPEHRFEITGSEGMLRWDNADATLRLFRAGVGAWETFAPPEGFERNWLFMDEMRHFLSVCRGEVEPVCSLAGGLRALEIGLRARQSAVDGLLQRIG